MLHQDYLNRLRKLDRKVNQTPAGKVGPLERGFSEITNASDFKGWVVGFYGEQSKALAGVANMIADAQTAKWQARYGREPTDQQRAWLVNKVRTDIAMKATKLNAQVQLTNLQAMYERGKATSDQPPAEAAGTRVPGLGASAGARTAHGWRPRAQPPRGLAGAVED